MTKKLRKNKLFSNDGKDWGSLLNLMIIYYI